MDIVRVLVYDVEKGELALINNVGDVLFVDIDPNKLLDFIKDVYKNPENIYNYFDSIRNMELNKE